MIYIWALLYGFLTTVQYSTVQYSTVQYNTLRTLQYSTIIYSLLGREKIFCLQCCALIGLERKNVIKYCAPIRQNPIWKFLKGFALGYFSMEEREEKEVLEENEEEEEEPFT